MNENDNSNCDCSSPSTQHCSNHLESRENQFSSTLKNSSVMERTEHNSAHLVINNFLAPQKSILPAHLSDHRNSVGEPNCVKNTHSNFLKIYFFFSYYLCLTPFRFKKVIDPAESESSSLEIHEYLPQQVICAVSNILALVRYAVEFRRSCQEVHRANPISFFKLFEACSGLLFKAVIIKCFWKNKRSFLNIARFLDSSPYILPYNKFRMESVFTISSVCGFYVMIGFARMIAGSGFVRSASLNFSWWSRRLVAEARYSFFLTSENHVDLAPPIEEISSLDIFLAIITGFTFQCRYIAGYFVDVGIFICVLTLWAPVAGFSNSIRKQLKEEMVTEESEKNKPSPPLSHQVNLARSEVNHQEVVMKQYKALKELTELITQANGETILPFIGEAVFGYAIFFEDVLITTDLFHRIVLACFYCCAVNILIFSADVCRKMQCMRTWLWDEERFSTFPSQRLMVVLHDLSTNAVGINASGIFTVDFYLVGSMISVLITLFIIRLQYQAVDV